MHDFFAMALPYIGNMMCVCAPLLLVLCVHAGCNAMQAFNSGRETLSAGRRCDLWERGHTHTFTVLEHEMDFKVRQQNVCRCWCTVDWKKGREKSCYSLWYGRQNLWGSLIKLLYSYQRKLHPFLSQLIYQADLRMLMFIFFWLENSSEMSKSRFPGPIFLIVRTTEELVKTLN